MDCAAEENRNEGRQERRNYVVTSGEILIDMIPAKEKSNRTGVAYCAHPGGAPANVAVGLARLGCASRFFGKLSTDKFGNMLYRTLQRNGVDVGSLPPRSPKPTAIALVTLDRSGNRAFGFYHRDTAHWDMLAGEVNRKLLSDVSVCHVGSVSLSTEPSRTATNKLIELARRSGKLVSADLNIRPQLWDDSESMVKHADALVRKADVLRCSREDLIHAGIDSSVTTAKAAVKGVMDRSQIIELSTRLMELGPGLVAITSGSAGAVLASRNGLVGVPALKVRALDTTGAGDAFTAGLLCRIVRKGITSGREASALTEEELYDFGAFSSVAAGISCRKHGGIESLPFLKEVIAAETKYRHARPLFAGSGGHR